VRALLRAAEAAGAIVIADTPIAGATTTGNSVNVRFEQVGERFEVPVTVTLKYATTSSEVMVPVTEQVTTMRIPTTGPLRGVGVNEDGAAPVVLVK